MVWGADRAEAIDRLRRSLSEFVVKGIKTSIPFHQQAVRHPVFIGGKYDTGFVADHMDGGLLKEEHDTDDEREEMRRAGYLLAAVAEYRRAKQAAVRSAGANDSGGRAGNPWTLSGRWSQMRGGGR